MIVNGTPIRWIDAKNYYGAHIVSKRLISKQLASYVKEWGPGAIVFGMGYSDMFAVPGVMCLDTTPFPKTRSEAFKMRVKAFLYAGVNRFRWKRHLGSELTQEYLPHPAYPHSLAINPASGTTDAKKPQPGFGNLRAGSEDLEDLEEEEKENEKVKASASAAKSKSWSSNKAARGT